MHAIVCLDIMSPQLDSFATIGRHVHVLCKFNLLSFVLNCVELIQLTGCVMLGLISECLCGRESFF